MTQWGAKRRPRGQLKAEILDATDALLAQGTSPTELSIDAVLAAVGCTPPSLYHYFPSKDALLAAASRRRYQQFADDLESRLDGIADPVERLRARGRAYLAWGIDHPRLYELQFLQQAPTAGEPDTAAGMSELMANTAQAFPAAAHTVPEMAVGLWAIVHGITTIAIANPAMPAEFAQTVLDQLTTAAITQYRHTT